MTETKILKPLVRHPYRDPFSFERNSPNNSSSSTNCFNATFNIYNPTNNKNMAIDLVHNQSHQKTEYRDYSEILKISPVKKHFPKDELDFDMMPKLSNSIKSKSQTNLREIVHRKDEGLSNIGERANHIAKIGKKRFSEIKTETSDRVHNPYKHELRFYVEKSASSRDLSNSNSPTRVSRVIKAIYEQYTESLECFPQRDYSKVEDLEASSRSLFSGVIEGLEAAGGIGTLHKKFVSNPVKKRFYSPQKQDYLNFSFGNNDGYEEIDQTIEACKAMIQLKLRAKDKIQEKMKVKDIIEEQVREKIQRGKQEMKVEKVKKRNKDVTSIELQDDSPKHFDQTFPKTSTPKASTPQNVQPTKKVQSLPTREKKIDDSPKKEESHYPVLSKTNSELITTQNTSILRKAETIDFSSNKEIELTPTNTLSSEKSKPVVVQKGFLSQMNNNYGLNKSFSMANLNGKTFGFGNGEKANNKNLVAAKTPKYDLQPKIMPNLTKGFFSLVK